MRHKAICLLLVPLLLATACSRLTFVRPKMERKDGEQIALSHAQGTRYYDAWHGRALTPRIIDGAAYIELPMEARGFGAVLSVQPGVAVDGGIAAQGVAGVDVDEAVRLARSALIHFGEIAKSADQRKMRQT